ncbi:MAG: IS256 family transposase [Bacteroidales bacterium]
MNFTQEQITEILIDFSSKKSNGYQLILKIAIEALMRAEREEFKELNSDVSNGFRKRSVYSNGYSIELAVPRTRANNFYPLILALINDQDEELAKIVSELYCSGLTTEQVGNIVEKVYGRNYSKSRISSLMDNSRIDVQDWLNRRLNAEYPIIYIDATFWYTRRDGAVSSEAYYTILGVKSDMTREVLAIVNHPTEGSENWEAVLRTLKERGAKGVKLVVSDAINGIENSITAVFPEAKHQLCTVHLMRNIYSKVKPEDRVEVTQDLKEVLNPDNKDDTQIAGYERFVRFLDKWGEKYTSLKRMKANPRYSQYFTYLNYHVSIRRMIYTTNWIERLNRNYKRTLRMRTSMPSPESVIFLLGSVAMRRKEFDYPIYQFKHETKLF